MDRDAIVRTVLAGSFDLTDADTGLCPEPWFRAILTLDLRRARRSGDPLTIGIFGFDSGSDPAFGEIGALIQGQIREVDLAAQRGDGNFVMILSHTAAESGRRAAEGIRTAVEAASRGKATMSFGLASFPEDGLDEVSIVGRAADAYLHAVSEGGNRVYFFERARRQSTAGRPRVLLVDDDSRNLKLLGAQIAPLGYELLTASSGEHALEMVRTIEVDLVILDVMMPGLSGFETCRRIKANEATRLVPIVLLTALDDADSRLKGIESGADEFISKPANKEELFARTRSLVRVKRLNRDLVSLESALISLANAVEAKDNYTLGHTQRVSTLAVALGVNMGLNDEDLKALRLGGILHDVGKIGVPEEILNKPGPLTEKEWELMKRHPEVGYRICLPLLESIGPALDVIRHHHEKLDGSSYPDGLQGNSISRMARIMAVVDSYDAMITDRPYRLGMGKGKALGILQEEVAAGRLDGLVVHALESLVADPRSP